MLTYLTQEAIRLLRFIHYRNAAPLCAHAHAGNLFPDSSLLLPKLERGGLICCVHTDTPQMPDAYELCLPLSEIDLLRLLLVLDEGIHPVPADADEARVYERYGPIATRLGIVNQMIRSIFCDIRLTDLR